jgi:hypothetical protein
MRRAFIFLLLIIFAITVFCGCEGGKPGSGSSVEGNVNVVVNYPQDMKTFSSSLGVSRFSEATVSYFLIDVYNSSDISSPVTSPTVVSGLAPVINTTRINYPETTATIKSVPVGEKSFIIQGLDANNNLTYFGSFSLDVNTGSNNPGKIILKPWEPVPGVGTVTGIITNKVTGNAISGVSVVIGEAASGVSDASGKYTIDGVVAGDQNITATAAGYLDYSSVVKVTANQTFTHNFQMPPAVPQVGIITGRVTAKANDSDDILNIAGAVVSIGTLSAVTGENGIYTLPDVPVGTHTLSVTAETYQNYSAQVTVTSGTSLTHNVLLVSTLPQTGKVTGTVTDCFTGLPISGAYVSSDSIETYTLTDGTYTINGVAFGTHYIFASAPDYEDYNDQVTVDTHTPVIRDIEMITTTGTVSGVVEDAATSDPIEGVVVFIGAISATSNATGNYTLENVPQGVQTIEVQLENYVDYSSSVNITAGGTTTKNLPIERLPFKFTILVPTDNFSYSLPLTYVSEHTHKFRVDWGDGNDSVVSVFDDPSGTHVYAVAGTYQVKISGVCPGFKIDEWTHPSDIYKSVDSWGYADLREISFSGCYYLETLPNESGKLTLVENFEYAFAGCQNLTAIPPGLFAGNTVVTSFRQTFWGCSQITSIPPGLFDDNINVTTFEGTFYNCKFSTIPAGLFHNNQAVTTFESTFFNCTNLISIPGDLFITNTAVTNFHRTFETCTSLSSIPLLLFSENKQVTTFARTFVGCTSLTSIPAGLFTENIAVESFRGTFIGCVNLNSIPTGLFSTNTVVTDFEFAFFNCSGIAGDVILSLPEQPWEWSTPPSGTNCFNGCNFGAGGITNGNQIPTAWGGLM